MKEYLHLYSRGGTSAQERRDVDGKGTGVTLFILALVAVCGLIHFNYNRIRSLDRTALSSGPTPGGRLVKRENIYIPKRHKPEGERRQSDKKNVKEKNHPKPKREPVQEIDESDRAWLASTLKGELR